MTSNLYICPICSHGYESEKERDKCQTKLVENHHNVKVGDCVYVYSDHEKKLAKVTNLKVLGLYHYGKNALSEKYWHTIAIEVVYKEAIETFEGGGGLFNVDYYVPYNSEYEYNLGEILEIFN